MFSIFESLFPSQNDAYYCEVRNDNNKKELYFNGITGDLNGKLMTKEEIKKEIGESKFSITGWSNGCNATMTFLEDIENDSLKNQVKNITFDSPYDKMDTGTALNFFGRSLAMIIPLIWNELKRDDEVEKMPNLTKKQINNSKHDIVVQKEKRNPVVNALWNYVARPIITGVAAGIAIPLSIVSLPFIGCGMLIKSIYNRCNDVDNSKYCSDEHIFHRLNNFIKSNNDVNGEIRYSVNDPQLGDLGLCEEIDSKWCVKDQYNKDKSYLLAIKISNNNNHCYSFSDNIKACEKQNVLPTARSNEIDIRSNKYQNQYTNRKDNDTTDNVNSLLNKESSEEYRQWPKGK
jgi:hypothetical protein